MIVGFKNAASRFDTSKVRERIIELYECYENFAEIVDSPVSYVTNYLDGNTILSQPVLTSWIEALAIPDEEVDLYFFTVRKGENE